MIYQAIETRYLSCTNTKGGRIKATAWGGSATISYPHELNTDDAHKAAAMALVAKMGWPTSGWTQGGNVKGTGYYFVRADNGK